MRSTNTIGHSRVQKHKTQICLKNDEEKFEETALK